ncbi:uncharacterized protein LOC133185066 [Saccostrea echinata]|uniref:uncharacterized protein LOC133185066 n=1 Tax=Saccostrea echinata TaxID=191078 RepID=UPI002A82F6A1|nr:uncharacterized protein LOC133185066 [Saccostrea echinata]
MTRHVFGNNPSPAVATCGLRKCVIDAEDVKGFVYRNFYVDDGLMSFDGSDEAVNLLSRTQTMLKKEGNIRLHKITSNSLDVIKAFPQEDLAKEVTGIELDLSEAPLQRSLGVSWDISKDSFTFQVTSTHRPFTKRGVLATINGLYDPIGIVAPVTIRGKLIMQDVMSSVTDWDEPIPHAFQAKWHNWVESLVDLQSILIPRCYVNLPSSEVQRRELHVFSDASQKAISAVAYLKICDVSGGHHVSFVHGKARVAPSQGHTIPRLELCAAVLATRLKDTITQHLTVPIDSITMYTDSRVVLGYINNEHRRFYVYVGNRVDMIRHSTTSDQWTFVSSEDNPADISTRSIPANEIEQSAWIQGPSILRSEHPLEHRETSYELIDPEEDKEVRPVVIVTKKTSAIQETVLVVHRFERFSTWRSLVRAIARIKRVAKSYRKSLEAPETLVASVTTDELTQAELFVVQQVQQACFPSEVSALKEGRELHRTSSIISLSPILDSYGIMRVGGRLRQGRKSTCLEVHPVIIPKNSHIADLIIHHFHESVHHQGRHITEGKIRTAGYWIIGCKRKVTSHIHSCVICRKLRGRFGTQIMADLPEDRITPSPPFSFVGVDTFGPWNVVARRTRGGQANQKRWAILFTCLVCRAIHIEVIEELSSSSFINALKRFISIRGPVHQFRSDRGTNFVWAVNEIGLASIFVEDAPIQNFLTRNQAVWIFNPPHASHFGGAWERMIGVTRRILDSMLLRTDSKGITNEVLTTFMAEVCSIVNSRPLVAVSTDPEDPSVLTPNILLTQKMDSSTLPKDLPELDLREAYRSQWKHVVVLSQEFWKKWREQYLSNLQSKRKWSQAERNFKEGDIVLLKDYEVARNQWPVALVEKVFPSDDNRVRTVEIRVAKDRRCFVRPICELVPLIQD